MCPVQQKLIICVIGLAIANTSYGEDPHGSVKKLQGTWRLVSGEYVDGAQRIAFSSIDVQKKGDATLAFTVEGNRLKGHSKSSPDYPNEATAHALCYGEADLEFYGAEEPLRLSLVHRSRDGKPLETALLYRFINDDELEIAGNPRTRNIAVESFSGSLRSTWRLERVLERAPARP